MTNNHFQKGEPQVVKKTMKAYRVMFESGPHKPAVEVTGLILRICEIVQDYDEKVQGLVQPLESLQD